MLGFVYVNQNSSVQASLNNALLHMGVDGKIDMINEQYFKTCSNEAEENEEIGLSHMKVSFQNNILFRRIYDKLVFLYYLLLEGLFFIVAGIAASGFAAMVLKFFIDYTGIWDLCRYPCNPHRPPKESQERAKEHGKFSSKTRENVRYPRKISSFGQDWT